jgi:hypothetical protein
MSRSYQRVSGWTDDNRRRRRWAKRLANKRVRRIPEIPDGRAYRKVFNSWDIQDFKFLDFHSALWQWDELMRDSATETEAWVWWHRAWSKK